MGGESGSRLSLEARLEVLQDENLYLSENSEAVALLGAVSECLSFSDDPPELLAGVLEKISILKDLPVCACCRLVDGRAVVMAEYVAFSDQSPELRSLVFSSSAIDLFKGGPVIESLKHLQDRGLDLQTSTAEFQAESVALFPFSTREVDRGAFVFLGDGPETDRLWSMKAVLERVVEMVTERLDRLSLMAALRVANADLDRRIEERTTELAAANRLLEQEIGERQGAEAAFRALIRSTVGVTGQSCFESVVSSLCEWLGADGATVGELGTDGSVCFLAVQADGSIVSSDPVPLSGTPMQQVVRKGYVAFENDVSELYPRFSGAMPWEASGYVGAVVRDPEDIPIGLVSCSSRGSLRLPNNAREVMEMIAARAGAEIDRSRSEKDRLYLERQLNQAQKMEAVGQLAGGIAHDFNNLLHVIIGCSELAEESVPQGSQTNEELDEILKAAGRASELVQRLLTFSRPHQVERHLVNLNDVVGDGVKMLERVIDDDIELVLHSCEEALGVIADPGQIQQVLMNLTVNSRDAMPEGGILTIETEMMRFDRETVDAFPWSRLGRYAVLVVSDTGGGMTAEVQERACDPFFTTKGAGRGTGLGLSTVYGIATQHGGGMALYSEPGVGTTIRIYFLAETEGPLAPELVEIDGGRDLSGSETILIAEDDELVRRLTTRILREGGYVPIVAADGDQACRLFDENADDIDLVLLDVVMPRKSGFEVRDLVATKRPRLPVLFASGYSFHALAARQASPERMTVIAKPYSKNTLLGAIRDALDCTGRSD